MQVILDSSFARSGSAPTWGGKKGEFRDWTKGNSASAPSRFASLSERHSGKAKQITNWSVSTFKGKLKFYR